MSNVVTWTVRTPINPHAEPMLEPDEQLRVCDLRWLLTEAERMGVTDYDKVSYVEPIPGGDPQGWGLTITRVID